MNHSTQASLSISNSRSLPKLMSHPLSSPSPPAFNLSQHQGLFQWVSSSHQLAKVLEFQLQHQSFQRTVLRWTVGCTCLFQIWFPRCVCPGVGFLGHMAVLVFKGISTLFSIVAVYEIYTKDIYKYTLNIFSHSLCLFFCFLDSVFQRAEVLNFDVSNLLLFSFMVNAFFFPPKKSLPTTRSQRYSPVLSSRSFIILAFILRSMVHLKWVFVYAVR